jgi:cell division protein FtsW (lipid II flippase)
VDCQLFPEPAPVTPDRIQSRLLQLAGIFLGLYSLALTLSPAVQARSWEAALRWDHWFGYLVWCLLFLLIDWHTRHRLPARDPFLIPVAAMLSGLGLLTIWRLEPAFGWRQSAWLAVDAAVLVLGTRLRDPLQLLRKYKYLWLTAGLLLTALTSILGTNPTTGSSPRLWLGCCGVYFQPSEPLKLLLVVYLAAYFSGRGLWLVPSASNARRPARRMLLPLLAPTVIMLGLTLLLLLVQRDLGTAVIFIFIYVFVAYLATGSARLLVLGGAVLILAGAAGYRLFDVVRLRVDAWLNPWADPSGGSYQIVQSLLAMANGGVGGRGPGLGSPGLVPIPHSDFIYAAILEEGGLVWAIGFLLLLGFFAASGLRIALRASGSFRQYLAAGLTAYLAGQSILIIGGNLRILPLTGVTLPFVSYGGSSLLTAFLSLTILLIISQGAFARPGLPANPRPYLVLGGFIFGGLALAAAASGWWTVYRGPDLLERTDNARRSISDRYVRRGAILDRHSTPLAVTHGAPGDYARSYPYAQLGPVIGYNDPVYGQSGLEASLDPYLRGRLGNSPVVVWWHHLLYGQPPPGIDVRLTLDLDLQTLADKALAGHTGAVVLLNAASGEILIMASHPTYDPNRLSEAWADLVSDPEMPLINRASQGRYQAGAALGPFLLASVAEKGTMPQATGTGVWMEDQGCALRPAGNEIPEMVQAGCPVIMMELAEALGEEDALTVLEGLGFYQVPDLAPGVALSPIEEEAERSETEVLNLEDLQVSPLQMAIAASALSANGSVPAPRLASAVDLPDSGWSSLPPPGQPEQVILPQAAFIVAESLQASEIPTWESLARISEEDGGTFTWYLTGTLPTWNGAPLSLVILLEEDDPGQAQAIGTALMRAALQLE